VRFFGGLDQHNSHEHQQFIRILYERIQHQDKHQLRKRDHLQFDQLQREFAERLHRFTGDADLSLRIREHLQRQFAERVHRFSDDADMSLRIAEHVQRQFAERVHRFGEGTDMSLRIAEHVHRQFAERVRHIRYTRIVFPRFVQHCEFRELQCQFFERLQLRFRKRFCAEPNFESPSVLDDL